MIEFEIKPLQGIGPINFGMQADQVHKLLGKPSSAHGNFEMFLDGFKVHYDHENAVEFIELAESSSFKATFNGRCLHTMPAETVIAFIRGFDSFDENDLNSATASFSSAYK